MILHQFQEHRLNLYHNLEVKIILAKLRANNKIYYKNLKGDKEKICKTQINIMYNYTILTFNKTSNLPYSKIITLRKKHSNNMFINQLMLNCFYNRNDKLF